MLVVANVTATSRELVGALKEQAADEPTTFTLIIPARGGRAAAHETLAEALEHLRDQGLEVDGSVGHTNPLVAITEAWNPSHYDEIIVSTLPADISKWLHAGLPHRIEKLTGASVRHIVSPPPRPPVPVTPAPRQGPSGVVFDPISVLRSSRPAEVSTRASAEATTIAEHEAELVAQANASGRQPVVFIHGLWLLPSSWNRWATVFEDAGYVALTPGWPDDPETVEEAKAKPELFAHKTIGQVANHFALIIGKLEKKPALIGHSFGGLLAQIIAGRGLATVSVAIDPAPFRGVLPLPISALKSARPVSRQSGQPQPCSTADLRAVPLRVRQRRQRGRVHRALRAVRRARLCHHSLPGSRRPTSIPWTEAKVDNRRTGSGGRSLSSAARRTMPFPGRSRHETYKTPEGPTRASPRSSRCPAEDTR